MLTLELNEGPDNDAFKSMSEICYENGFASQGYNITTADGYILELWRIPGQFDENVVEGSKPVILLMHGLEGDMM